MWNMNMNVCGINTRSESSVISSYIFRAIKEYQNPTGTSLLKYDIIRIISDFIFILQT